MWQVITELPRNVLITVLTTLAVGLVTAVTTRLLGTLRSRRLAPPSDWMKTLNALFEGRVHVIRQVLEEPHVKISDARLNLSPSQATRAADKRATLQREGCDNDMHGMLDGEPAWDSDSVVLTVVPLDFAEVLTLRDDGVPPRVLSSCAVLVCPETRQVLLHKRSDKSASFENLVHTIGGSYQPPAGMHASSDEFSLLDALVREVKEEARIRVTPGKRPTMILSEELNTGFVQLVVLGIVVSRKSLQAATSNWEGELYLKGFDDLPALLKSDDMVPSGNMQLLAWLAFGAPGAGLRRRFGGMAPRELFKDISGSAG